MITANEKNKTPHGAKRSRQWPAFRRAFIKAHPSCAVCGHTDTVEAHHIVPFHIDPSRELDVTNLITLCESKKRAIHCHLLYGHRGNFRSWNTTVVEDAMIWNYKLKTRPKG